MNKKKFAVSLEAQNNLVHIALASVKHLNPSNIRQVLDNSAKIITKGIYFSLKLSIERSKGCGKGKSW